MQLCVSVKGPTLIRITEQLERAVSEGANLVELRWDLFESFDPEELHPLLESYPLGILSTVRSQGQGGQFSGTPQEYEERVMRCATCRPEWVDVEVSAPVGMIQRLRTRMPQTKILVSNHILDGTPTALDQSFVELKSLPGDLFKLATTASNSIDTLSLLQAIREENCQKPLFCGIAMGEDGAFGRVLAPLVNMPLMFAALSDEEATAPGQLSIRELRSTYRQMRVDRTTRLFALIGDPVEPSPGHLVHNSIFNSLDLPAVYVKIRLLPDLLVSFFNKLRAWNWGGLSVTMPLKAAVQRLCDRRDFDAVESGAVNTVVFEKNQVVGYNTDGEGALNAIEAQTPYSMKGARFVIAGAGGTATAVAVAAKRRAARVTLVNRHPERAKAVAERVGVEAFGLDHLPRLLHEGPEVFANCTSVGLAPDREQCLCKPEDLRENTLVFDAVANPPYTRLIRNAWQAGCNTVTGLDMFTEQALLQYRYWFQGQLDEEDLRRLINTIISQLL